MLQKGYYRQQAQTLRKMADVAANRTVADRLRSMAANFDRKASAKPAYAYSSERADRSADEEHG